jgi:hypothetical protein
VIDLEGLVTPQVNDLRRAGQSLAPFLRDEGVEYVVLYHDSQHQWQDQASMTPVLTAALELNTISATDRMTVYRLEWGTP